MTETRERPITGVYARTVWQAHCHTCMTWRGPLREDEYQPRDDLAAHIAKVHSTFRSDPS